MNSRPCTRGWRATTPGCRGYPGCPDLATADRQGAPWAAAPWAADRLLADLLLGREELKERGERPDQSQCNQDRGYDRDLPQIYLAATQHDPEPEPTPEEGGDRPDR